MGDSWTADLKCMYAEKDDSWYDLRITMTDATGNSFSQMISPAFYIGEGSGVKPTHELSDRHSDRHCVPTCRRIKKTGCRR